MNEFIKYVPGEKLQCTPAVTRLQEALEMIGCYHGEVDGKYGPITMKAVKAFQRTHHLARDGMVGPLTWAAIHKSMDAIMSPGKPRVEIADPCLFDFRRGHAKPKKYKKTRDWKHINGITLHQTGCKMGSTPESWKRLNAHIGITRRGECVLVNELTDWIWHAQALSKGTVGIEIEGNYAGIEGNPNTVSKGGGPETHLTQVMIEAASMAIEWVVRQFVLNNQKFEHIYAHRQSYKMREADPGSEIWQQIAIPWIEKLGVSSGEPGFQMGSGKPIPKEWDSNSTWRYWG